MLQRSHQFTLRGVSGGNSWPESSDHHEEYDGSRGNNLTCGLYEASLTTLLPFPRYRPKPRLLVIVGGLLLARGGNYRGFTLRSTTRKRAEIVENGAPVTAPELDTGMFWTSRARQRTLELYGGSPAPRGSSAPAAIWLGFGRERSSRAGQSPAVHGCETLPYPLIR